MDCIARRNFMSCDAIHIRVGTFLCPRARACSIITAWAHTACPPYGSDGQLSIDNNAAENAIRPFCVDRKNWLISASVSGAKSSANIYSIIETAKVNELESYQYLRHIFTELPKAVSIKDIERLLPWDLQAETKAT